MARPARTIECTPEQRDGLEAILKSRKQKSGIHLRVRMILQCIDGWKISDIASANKVTSATVMLWKNRYIKHGLGGLRDNARSGRPATYTQDFKSAILAKLEEDPPTGYAQWDGPLLAAQTGYSKHAIWRLLRSQRICLARKRSWCVSTDPLFAAKAADVVGLYLAPPESALVLCVDEKPNIQALERTTGYAVSSDRKLVRALESTYQCGAWALSELRRLNHMADSPPTQGEWSAWYARLLRLIKKYRAQKNAAGKLVRHLEREMGSLWTFLEENGVDATNNFAERTLRFAVTWRKRRFGSRNDKGERFVERVLSLRQTCRLRKLRTWPILVDAYAAFLARSKPELVSQIA